VGIFDDESRSIYGPDNAIQEIVRQINEGRVDIDIKTLRTSAHLHPRTKRVVFLIENRGRVIAGLTMFSEKETQLDSVHDATDVVKASGLGSGCLGPLVSMLCDPDETPYGTDEQKALVDETQARLYVKAGEVDLEAVNRSMQIVRTLPEAIQKMAHIASTVVLNLVTEKYGKKKRKTSKSDIMHVKGGDA